MSTIGKIEIQMQFMPLIYVDVIKCEFNSLNKPYKTWNCKNNIHFTIQNQNTKPKESLQIIRQIEKQWRYVQTVLTKHTACSKDVPFI